MFGEKALELISELKRARDGVLPPYNEDGIRQVGAMKTREVVFVKELGRVYSAPLQVLEETRSLFEQNQREVRATTDGEQGLFSGIQLRHACLERNQRCLLAYAYNRLRTLRDVRWDMGSVLPEEVRLCLCEQEVQWFSSYNRLLATYMRSVGGGMLDLTLHTSPPKSLYIEVRCLLDYGEFETEDGTVVQLRKGSQHNLPRSQCEHLIRQGVLEHVQ